MRGKIGNNALTVTLFKQLPWAQIVHQEANDQMIVLSPKNAQKVHSRSKLWAFEKKFPRNTSLNEGALFKRPPRTQILMKSKIYAPIRQIGGILPRFYTNPSLFLVFTVFTSSVNFFWSFPAQRASIALQCCRPVGPPSLRDGSLKGGYNS